MMIIIINTLINIYFALITASISYNHNASKIFIKYCKVFIRRLNDFLFSIQKLQSESFFFFPSSSIYQHPTVAEFCLLFLPAIPRNKRCISSAGFPSFIVGAVPTPFIQWAPGTGPVTSPTF